MDKTDLKTECAPELETTAADGGFLLPSGKRVVQVEATGKHIRLARRAQIGGADYLYAMIAQVSKIDGKAIIPEELDDYPAADVNKLIEETLGKL